MSVFNYLLLWSILIFPEVSFSQVIEKLSAPNPLQGRVGTAHTASIDAVSVNPAQAGLLRLSEVQVKWTYKNTNFLYRYPRFDTHQKTSSGFDGVPIPSFVWKPMSKLGVSGFIVPFAVRQEIEATRLPIILLGQEQYVDLKGEGVVPLIALLNVGWAMNPQHSFGLGIQYFALNVDTDLIASNERTTLTSIESKLSQFVIKLGYKFRLSPAFSFGMQTGLLESTSNRTKVESALATSDSDDSLDSSSDSFVNPIRIGAMYSYGGRFNYSVDLEYKRANKSQEAFSTVDLKNKTKDVEDTLSLYSGGDVRINPSWRALFGFLYEPSEVGPGSASETGFGFMDLAQALGEAPERPQWLLGGGFRYTFSAFQRRQEISEDGRTIKSVGNEKNMNLDFGLLYGETSIGVDESGEQPGAYVAKRYQIPLRLSYKF